MITKQAYERYRKNSLWRLRAYRRMNAREFVRKNEQILLIKARKAYYDGINWNAANHPAWTSRIRGQTLVIL